MKLDYDMARDILLPGLIPFAFSGAGDIWCWNTQVVTGDAEYEILNCWRDDDADTEAPTFASWFYRRCLDFASGAFENNPEEIEDARERLRGWADRLEEIHPGAWPDHICALADTNPFEYVDPRFPKMGTLFGFITSMEVDEIVAREFGPRYLERGTIDWGTFNS